MKLENVRVGQIVKDSFGNRYKVLEVANNKDDQPVKLRCTRHLGEHYYSTKSPSEETKYTFGIGGEWWIHKDMLKDFSIVKAKKAKDLKVGQIVVDKHGNEYEVYESNSLNGSMYKMMMLALNISTRRCGFIVPKRLLKTTDAMT